ncbi:MAG: erythromycin esterase family protein [Bacteroidales bacterium]|nr:erythromycin esterase family protein [Bacteroidales bacterium]
MANKGSKKHTLRWILLTLFFGGIFVLCFYAYFGGFKKVKPIDTKGFAMYAGDISGITIPDSVRIIGLGEATHGNAEFQQLKLDVFKLMVEKYGVRAFALEGDYGGCEAVNRYIHGGAGTAQEAVAAIGFPIYRTEQMAQLIDWMRQYNATAKEGEDLRFYGFDMQIYENNYKYLLEAAKTYAVPTAELEKLWDNQEGKYSASCTADQKAKVIEEVKQELLRLNDSTTAQALHFADMLLQNIALGKVFDNRSKGVALRDSLMFVNTHWIMEQEAVRGNECIFISGHNGHIQRVHDYGRDGKAMGALLSDELGEAYFAIGTDFYKARVSLPKGFGTGKSNKRSNHTFFSKDPLSNAAKKCRYETCWLDFSKIPDGSTLKHQIADYMWMGDVGEGYSPLMAVFPMSYRDWVSPSGLYDGVILVTNAHPITVLQSTENNR